MDNFVKRLLEVISDKEGGKHTVFARKAGINPGTFQNYINGRKPSFDALLNICETYSVDLNWLVAGHGSKYINHTESRGKNSNYSEIEELQEWLSEICEEEPDRRAWFRMELMDKLPLFSEWLKKRHETEAEANYKIAL